MGAGASDVDLAGIRERGDSGRIDVSVGGKELRIGVHAFLHAKLYVGPLSRRRDGSCRNSPEDEAVLLCEFRTLPCAGIIQIRFKGYFSPTQHRPPTPVRRRTPALAAHTIHRTPGAWQPVSKWALPDSGPAYSRGGLSRLGCAV